MKILQEGRENEFEDAARQAQVLKESVYMLNLKSHLFWVLRSLKVTSVES